MLVQGKVLPPALNVQGKVLPPALNIPGKVLPPALKSHVYSHALK